MTINILDEKNQLINQIAVIENKPVNPLLLACVQIAYKNDPHFKAIIDDFIKSFNEIMKEFEVSSD